MIRYTPWMVTALTLALGAQAARAGTGVGAKVGTLGLGLEITKTMAPRVNARAGVNFFDYEYTTSDNGIDYTGSLALSSGTLLADFHPVPLLGFRVTGGVLFNGNTLDLIGTPAETKVDIGGVEYEIEGVGEVNGMIEFSSLAPYAGIGWGNAASSVVGFNVDLGIAFQGSPAVGMTVTGELANDEVFLEDLEQEAQELAETLKGFKYYPVVSVGLSVKLWMF